MNTRRPGSRPAEPRVEDEDDAHDEREDTRIDSSGAIGASPRSDASTGLSSEGIAVDVADDLPGDIADEIADALDDDADPEATVSAPPPSATEQAYKLPQQLGRYTLTKLLGVGGMAEVFLAEQAGVAGFKKVCVVKRMLRHLALEPRFVDMFLREAHLASTLHHANIVQIWDLGEADGSYFIAMEYVDGIALNQLARAAWRAARSIPTEVVCCALADTAEGLAAAHERLDERGEPSPIIHRDISPDNLMIGREGVTKILDFGIARIGTGERTSTGELKGKVPFMAPEQLRGQALDGRVDVFALGVTAYWLLTGKRPFVGATDLLVMQSILNDTPKRPREVNPGVPIELDDLVMSMLEKNPDKRIGNVRDVARRLEAATATRRNVVVPFVRNVFALPSKPNPDEPISQTSGFLPSTPHTDSLKLGRLLFAGEGAADAARAVAEVSGSFPRRPPSAHELATVGRPEPVAFEDASDARLDDPTAGDASSLDAHAVLDTAEGAPAGSLHSQPTGPWALLPPEPSAPATQEMPVARRLPHPAVLGVAAGLVCVVGLSALVFARQPSTEQPASSDAGARDQHIAVVDPVATTSPGEPKPADPVVTPPPSDPAPPTEPPPDPAGAVDAGGASEPPTPGEKLEGSREAKRRGGGKREAPAKLSVVVKGPPEVQWLVDGRRVGSGSGTLQVPAGSARLVAWNKKRGVKTTVPIGSGAIDYAALPRGKLQPRAKPFAEVFLGQESLGTTPFPAVEVVAGSYTVRFVYKDKEQTQTVEVGAGSVVKPIVDFAAAP